MCFGSLLLQVQSQAGYEEPHSGMDEEWQTQNPRLLLGISCQDVQVGESVAAGLAKSLLRSAHAGLVSSR
jgi:hypothetical protein